MKSDDPHYFDVRAKTYVRYVLDELKLSPSKLAKDAGLATTTLTRALNDPTHKYTLSMSTLGKIFKATGINFNPFFEPNDYPALSMVPYSAKDLYDESWGEGANTSDYDNANDAHSTIVIGEAAIGIWKEEKIGRLEDLGLISVAIPNTPASQTFALKMADDSASPYVQKGEYALCLRHSPDEPFRHGDLVVLERWNHFPKMMELSVRRLIQREGEEPYLRADNKDAKFAQIVVPRPDLRDSDTVKLVGVVTLAVRHIWDEVLIDELNEMIRRNHTQYK